MRKMRGSAGRRARKKEIGKWVRWWGRSSRGNRGGGKRKTSGGLRRRKRRWRLGEKFWGDRERRGKVEVQ